MPLPFTFSLVKPKRNSLDTQWHYSNPQSVSIRLDPLPIIYYFVLNNLEIPHKVLHSMSRKSILALLWV